MASSNVLGNWQPYSGGKPPDPAPLGALPKGDNPRYPVVGPTKVEPPPGGYKSVINTKTPLDPAKIGRIRNVTRAFENTNKGGSGNNSRSAFARALADATATGLTKAADTFNVNFKQASEKSLAEDIQAQRSNLTDRFTMLKGAAQYERGVNTAYTEGIKDDSQRFETEKKNEEAKRAAQAMSAIGGLIGFFL